MRLIDILRLALSSWRRQKTRSSLTLLGVLLGACMLTVSLSIGEGVRNAMEHHFRQNDRLRRIVIFPDYKGSDDETGIPAEEIAVQGEMSPQRRTRIRRQLIQRWRQAQMKRAISPLTQETIADLASIAHVDSALPIITEWGRCELGGRTAHVGIHSADCHSRGLAMRLIAGRVPQHNGDDAILLNEMIAYDLGIRSDADLERAIGAKIVVQITNVGRGISVQGLLRLNRNALSLEESRLLEKLSQALPESIERLEMSPEEKELLRRLIQERDQRSPNLDKVAIRHEFTVAGILRIIDRDEEMGILFEESYPYADVVVPAFAMQKFSDQLPRRERQGYDSAIVRVDREENVRSVIEQIKQRKLSHYSAVDFVDHVLREIRLIRYATGFIAFIALLVAALGITNTMVTSVLERIQEIGIMKAVGARDRHILAVFLVEGALLGLLGGSLGLFVAWLASLPGDRLARKIMSEQIHHSVETSIFVFPPWLLISVPLFAMLMTTLAALYPARRASRVDPVVALRHE